MSDYEVNYMLGYVDTETLAYEAANGHVERDNLVYHIREMNEMWGGYEGLLTYCRLLDEDRELAKKFRKDFREVIQRDGRNMTVYHDFNEDCTEEQWRKDVSE